MHNSEKPFENPEMEQYFHELPAFVQESIAQSSMSFDSLEKLKQFAEHLNQQD